MAGRRVLVIAVAVLVLLGAATFLLTRPADPPPVAAPTATPRSTELFAAPGVDGDCSRRNPCGSLDQALAAATAGQAIRLKGGDYGTQLLKPGSSHTGPPVRLISDPADPAQVGQLFIEASGVEISGLRVDGEVRVRKQAADVTLTGLDVTGTVDIEGDRAVLRGSRVRLMPNRDGVSVRSGAAGVQLLDNVIGPGSRSPGSPAHVDCLQVSAATDLLIKGNTLFRCPAQTILIKADRGPIVGVQIRNNVIQGCLTRTETCDGYKSLQVRTAQEMRDIVVEGNTIDGALVFDDLPGLVVTRNLMSGDPGCLPGSRDNVVGKSSCPQVNRVADVSFPGRADEVPNLAPGPACACEGYGAKR